MRKPWHKLKPSRVPTRKEIREGLWPVQSWRKQAPKTIRERGNLRNRCGGKCFLQPKTLAFPICAKNSCKVSCDGLRAAYSRARQFRRSKVARLALIRACHMKCTWTKARGRCER